MNLIDELLTPLPSRAAIARWPDETGGAARVVGAEAPCQSCAEVVNSIMCRA